MAILSLRNIHISFGGPELLDGVSFSIEPGERSAVTGRNGEGKSTLLKIIAGLIEPDSGDRIVQPGLKISYLEQDVPQDRPGIVRDVVGLEGHAAGKAISRLGLDAGAPFNSLSGGMRRRVLMAKALATDPDLILLDEPTNHLDIESIEYLESILKSSRAACLFVTHDRAFLRHVAKRILDLDRGELAGWNCDYQTFLRRKADLISDETVYWAKKSRKLKEEEAWIRRGVKARTTRNEGRVAALMALRKEFAERRTASGTARIQLQSGAESGVQVVKAEHVSFAYPGGKTVVKDFSARILRGERIGIVGANGTGKTTLLKLLTGRLEAQEGEITLGERVETAFLDQLREGLDSNRSVLENIAEDTDEVVVSGVRKHVYAYLQDFLFTPERARTPVRALSGGERARLMLAKRFMRPGNLLVLDEPTNDLDIETLELLEEQIANYKGTVLLVSHDREFLDRAVTGCFVLNGSGEVRFSAGGWNEAAKLLVAAKPQEEPAAKPQVPARSPEKRRLGYKEKRELESLPAEIEKTEREIAEIEEKLQDPAIYREHPGDVAALTSRLAELKEKLEADFLRWTELEELAAS